MNSASLKHIRRLALDLGPLLVFFVAFKFANIYVATAVFMVTVTATLATCVSGMSEP